MEVVAFTKSYKTVTVIETISRDSTAYTVRVIHTEGMDITTLIMEKN